jgi:aminoglycoside phosphotransferase (APT) family kinase protein
VAVLAALLADLGSCEWTTILPNPLAQGEIAGQAYVVERALPGRQAQGLLSDPVARTRLQTAAAATIGELHRRTAQSAVVGGELLDRWVDGPVDLIRRSIPMLSHSARNDQALKRLAAELHEALAGRRLPVGWIHGDFWPGNMLTTPDGAMLTGLVDWDLAARDELPLHDLLHMVLYTRKLVHRCELGDVVRALLNGTGWTPHERTLVASANLALMDDAAGERAMVLLYWLRHIASNFIQRDDYGRNWFWVKKNIEGVL